MNKYEKQIQQLNEERRHTLEDHNKTISEQRQQAQKACNAYNGQIGVINAERNFMREELRNLYNFLKKVGDVGIKVTVFDYQLEALESLNIDEAKIAQYGEQGQEKTGKLGDAVMLAFAPIAFAIYKTGGWFLKRSKDKKALGKYILDYEEEKQCWKYQTEQCEQLIKFYEKAAQIADIYRALVATVRDAIKNTIEPELSGIEAFLAADAVKNAINEGTDPDDAVVAGIAEYQGTAYGMHYIFVKNTFEYYRLVKEIFTEPLLTKMMSDRQITEEEYNDFCRNVDQIKEQQKKLDALSVFGGE